MSLRPKVPADRALLADLLNRQLKRLAALEREIADLMALLDPCEQRR